MNGLRLVGASLLALAWLASSASGSQDDANKPAASDPLNLPAALTVEGVAAGQEALEAAGELSAEHRAKAAADWSEALQQLGEQDVLRSESASFEQEAANAPAKLEELRAELAQAPPEPEAVVPEGAGLRDVERLREAAAAEATSARLEVDALKTEADRRAARLAALPDQLVQARDALQRARDALAAPWPDGEPIELRDARLAKLRARIQAAEARLERLQAEQRSYQAREELLQLQRDLARRDAVQTDKLANAWEATASEYRRRAASETQDATQVLLERIKELPDLVAVAEANQARREELSDPVDGLLVRIDEVRALRDERRLHFESLHQRFEAARRRYRVAGGTYSMSELLRRENELLPDERDLRRQSKRRREALVEAELKRFDLESERDGIYDVAVRVQQFMSTQPGDLEPAVRARREADALALFTAELDLIDKLRDSYRIYSTRLEELDNANVALMKVTSEFREFIAERILWVRSVEKGELFEPRDAWQAFSWLSGISAQAKVAQTLERLAPQLMAVGVALLLALWARRRAIARLEERAALIVSYRTDSIQLTFEAMFLTALIALPAPLVLVSLSWALGSIEDPTPWEHAWSLGLRDLDMLAFAVFYLKAATRAGGLCEAHFRWPKAATSALRRDLRWLIPIGITAHFVVWVMGAQSDPDWNNALGRGVFVLTMIAVSIFTARCFLPGRPVLGTFFERNPGSPIARLRYLWPVLAVGLPLSNGLIAAFGYYYSALHLEQAVGDTLMFVAVTVILFNLGLRWLFVARRRMTVQQALRRREKAQEESRQEGASLEPAAIVEDQVDIPAVDAQTRSLLRASVVLALLLGLPKIWGALVPSLHYFDRVQLWPQLALLDSAEDEELDVPARTAPLVGGSQTKPGTGNGSSSSSFPVSLAAPGTSEAPAEGEPVATPAYSMTLADLGLAIVLAVLGILAVRNVPGLLEISVLKRLPVDAGSRYAITTIARYVIAIVGGMAAFGAIHIGWDTVKWLAAALTFGLAFGLQEIFANFISGLIILLERPVRVGDTVTVGTVVGTVSRIHMRATTVVDFDNREYLVPNKNLITGEVINWTLTDSVTRVVFPVGVAYGSDTRLVRRLLMRAAQECKTVMQDPVPHVLFKSFGASSLDFELRVYIATRSVWIETVNQIHERVDDLFREAGIEIAFNQLDVHIRDGGLGR